MYASVRRYRLQSGSMDDLLHLIDTDFAETISQVDGFVAYEVIVGEADEVMTMTVFRDREAAAASTDTAAEWIRTTLAGQFDITRIDATLGEVAVSRAVADMLEPAHH
jgi:hypothetical protein